MVNHRKTSFLLFLLLSLCIARAQTEKIPVRTDVFERYFTSAQTFADNYPREKVHLHLDNTSYYVGDTIWFKVYLTEAEKNRPSRISIPVHVEIVDQLRNVSDRKIIKTENGEGHGQIVFNKSALSGYYEIRAFTKWMLAFSEKQYFSRVVPVYQRQKTLMDTTSRRIAVYSFQADLKIKLRPDKKQKTLDLRFFPESGQLVQGIPSVVAFEAISKDSLKVNLSGTLLSADGEVLTHFETLHNSMGCFAYTPSAENVKARVEYQGKTHTFDLPKALPIGYSLNATHRGGVIDIRIARNANTPADSLALFVSHQGRPFAWYPVELVESHFALFRMDTANMPGGMIQFSLINRAGNTLCDRFCYVMPKRKWEIQLRTNAPFYAPYDPICCHLQVKDREGKPVKAKISVAIRNAFESDFLEHDNTIYTDLLLTSDLKGYIHQPGYYFADASPERQRHLDILLLVHAWRKYDMSQLIRPDAFTPEHSPERSLKLRGQIKSLAWKRAQKGMMVSVLAQTDSAFVVGELKTDSLGCFEISIDSIENSVPALFQTKKEGRKRKWDGSVLLSRNFSPPLREFSSFEQHSEWNGMGSLKWLINLIDKTLLDSLIAGSRLLDEIVVKGKQPKRNKTIEIEQSIIAFYHIPTILNQLRDEGKNVYDLHALLNYALTGLEDSHGEARIGTPVLYGTILHGSRNFQRLQLLWGNIDMIENVITCKGAGACSGVNEHDPTLHKAESERWVMTYIIVKEGYNPDKNYNTRGIRYTDVQGYVRPLAFYSPVYPKGKLVRESQNQRTLYWHPNVETDESGTAVIHCYNEEKSTFLTISAETIVEGEPAAIVTHSMEQ